MLDLLKWRAHPERINESLSKLKGIDGSEIVKVGADYLLSKRFSFKLHIMSWKYYLRCRSFDFEVFFFSLFFLVPAGHSGHPFRYLR